MKSADWIKDVGGSPQSLLMSHSVRRSALGSRCWKTTPKLETG